MDEGKEIFGIKLHHSGLVNHEDGTYKGGSVEEFPRCSLDYISILQLQKAVRSLLYAHSDEVKFYWNDKDDSSPRGLMLLETDQDVMQMAYSTVTSVHKMATIYVIHPVDIPDVVESGIKCAKNSSSSNHINKGGNEEHASNNDGCESVEGEGDEDTLSDDADYEVDWRDSEDECGVDDDRFHDYVDQDVEDPLTNDGNAKVKQNVGYSEGNVVDEDAAENENNMGTRYQFNTSSSNITNEMNKFIKTSSFH